MGRERFRPIIIIIDYLVKEGRKKREREYIYMLVVWYEKHIILTVD